MLAFEFLHPVKVFSADDFINVFFFLIFQLGEEEASAVKILEYKPREQIAIKFPKKLKAGQTCTLTLEYSAALSNTYDGFYNSSYTDKDGMKRYR